VLGCNKPRLLNLERPRLPVKRLPVGRVSISNQVSGRLIGTAGLEQLACACGLDGGRMLRSVEAKDPSSVVAQDDQYEQHLERGRRDREEIQRDRLLGMVHEERAPSLRWRTAAPDHVLGDRRLRDVDAELEQLAMNSRRAHSGFARHIRLMRQMLWGSTVGRPRPLLFQRQ